MATLQPQMGMPFDPPFYDTPRQSRRAASAEAERAYGGAGSPTKSPTKSPARVTGGAVRRKRAWH